MKFIVASLVACVGITAQAQETKAAEPKGKAIVQVFSNFNADFSKEAESLGFELERSYLGYEYKLDGGLTVKGVMDIVCSPRFCATDAVESSINWMIASRMCSASA